MASSARFMERGMDGVHGFGNCSVDVYIDIGNGSNMNAFTGDG